MNTKEQILYMQARLSRLASERWDIPLAEVMSIFSENHVMEYIEECFGIFHVQGDVENLDEIENYLNGRNALTCL